MYFSARRSSLMADRHFMAADLVYQGSLQSRATATRQGAREPQHNAVAPRSTCRSVERPYQLVTLDRDSPQELTRHPRFGPFIPELNGQPTVPGHLVGSKPPVLWIGSTSDATPFQVFHRPAIGICDLDQLVGPEGCIAWVYTNTHESIADFRSRSSQKRWPSFWGKGELTGSGFPHLVQTKPRHRFLRRPKKRRVLGLDLS